MNTGPQVKLPTNITRHCYEDLHHRCDGNVATIVKTGQQTVAFGRYKKCKCTCHG